VFESRDAAYENFASKPPLDVFTAPALRAYVDHGFADTPDGQVRLKCEPEHEARTYEMGPRHRTFEHLGEVMCPVLVVGGNPEGNAPGALAPLVAERLPHARFVLMDALGHFGPMQDPPAVAALVAHFADELDADGG
jgi:pimeloyl-ACP methyl ester carboxylesterase